MTLDLFAGICVSNYATAKSWLVTIFAEDFDARVADIASRGIEPDDRETYAGKARKAIYRDPDGNEISFGGAIG